MLVLPIIDFVLYKNEDTYRQCVIVEDIDTNNYFDLTGCVVKMQIRQTSTSPVLLELSTTNTLINMDDASRGTFTLKFKSGNIENISEGEYFQDLIVVYPNNDKNIIWRGKAIIKEGVTK